MRASTGGRSHSPCGHRDRSRVRRGVEEESENVRVDVVENREDPERGTEYRKSQLCPEKSPYKGRNHPD